ncbi:hypothetical protein [Nonomuraea sp. NPDC003709]|uniref:hypothetical protein n=1 Tax=Nonomuraea sp. NPDC003709 TaxID=3154450 RepID=UPI0033A7D61D
MTRAYATDEQYERWFMAECCRCGRRRHKAGHWPDGYVCRTCADRAIRTRGTCPGCGQDRALPGRRSSDGAAICTTCAGFSQTFDCSRCGFESKLRGGRLCERCTLSDRLTAVLDDGAGRIRPELSPLFDLLVAMEQPGSGLTWQAIRRNHPGNVAQLLQQLALGQIPLTHDALHELQPWRVAAHLEELLVVCGVLPAVDKYICSFQRWLPGHLANVDDPEHVKTIRLFATWHVLPALRNRAERGHITPSVRDGAGDQIRSATSFLWWLDNRGHTLASCRQNDIDAWFAENTESARNRLRPFLTWAMQSRHCSRSLSLPAMQISRRATLTEDERLAAIRRLLIDVEIPQRLRVAAIIVLLYAQPLTQVVRLTIDDLLRDGEAVFLRLGEPPSPVPAPVASLLLDYIAARDNMNTATSRASRWLFPRPPGTSALPPRPPVRAPQRDRHSSGGRPRCRDPAATPRNARPCRRRRPWIPRQDHRPPPSGRWWRLEPLRRWGTRNVTIRPHGNDNSRQLNRRAHQ